jgi:class 3 adenylate cyclase
MIEPIGYLIVGLFAIGMALSFLAADPHSSTSRPLCLFFGLAGVAFLVNIPAYERAFGEPFTFWVRVFSVLEVGIVASAFEWIRRIGRTEVSTGPLMGGDDRLVRAAQGLVGAYGLGGIAFPEWRAELWNVPWTFAVLRRPEFWIFAGPFNLALVLVGVRLVRMLGTKLDHAEWRRLVALVLTTPFWCAGFVLPAAWKPVSFAIAETIFLVGAIRYHVLQGQRGQFLARFLSPPLVRLVRERGLSSIMQRTRVDLSAVACDLRGFTAFAETAAPEEIMKLLEEYYAAVGEAAIRSGGSIVNFAGDGILALVGAPIAYADHAERAVGLALEIRDRMDAVISGWRALGLEIGLGVGIASGFVTVGVIGGRERLEYTAIGPAVNLAARLCARAEPGQILADARVVGSAGRAGDRYRVQQLEMVELKGFARPVTIFRIVSRTRGDQGGGAGEAGRVTPPPAPARG